MKLLKFESSWCSGCKQQDRILEELTDIDIEKIDVEEQPEIANKFGIRSLPTMIVINGDEEITRFIGVTTLSKIKDAIS